MGLPATTPRPPRGPQKRITALEAGQRETNTRLGRIEDTLRTSSHLFELMHERLEHLEEGQRELVVGQRELVEGHRELVVGHRELVEGQREVVGRLDQLVEATIRDRTAWVEAHQRIADGQEALQIEVASSHRSFQHEVVETRRSLQQELVETRQSFQQELLETRRSFQHELTETRRAIVDRLDRVVEATIRDRTASSDRIGAVERRLDVVERRLSEREPPR